MTLPLVVTISEQRSGTKWLASLIVNQFGGVGLGEAFSPDGHSPTDFATFLQTKGFQTAMRVGHVYLLDEYFSWLGSIYGGRIHLDLMFNQTDWVVFGYSKEEYPIYEYLKSRDAFIILLERDEKDIFVSQKALEFTGKPHFWEQDTAIDTSQISPRELCPIEFLKFKVRLRSNRGKVKAAFARYANLFECRYEDVRLANSLTNQLEKSLGDFYKNIRTAPLIPVPSKVDYRNIFSNFDKLA